ncbi:MAG TPA: hypothetical protein VJS42_14350 [Steroidobacteraceae bacterium]|nr:hypothetical protein [Steroidobacteraceae bacterium]
MKLREIAYSRSGDKGDTANVCVFPYDDANWELLREKLTAEKVKEFFARTVKGSVERYEFPKLKGLNFVLHGALGGAYSASLMVDTQAKSYQSFILDMDI